MNRECAGGRSLTTNNSMRCGRCVSKCGGSCWRRARNTRREMAPPDPLYLARSGPPCSPGHPARLRTVSAPSGSYGPTVVSASRRRSSADHHVVEGQLERKKKQVEIRGLNRNYNHDLKNLFRERRSSRRANPVPSQSSMRNCWLRACGRKMARLTLARKIATIVLIVWKREECASTPNI